LLLETMSDIDLDCDIDCGECLCLCSDGCSGDGSGDSCCCYYGYGGSSSNHRSNATVHDRLRCCWCITLTFIVLLVASVALVMAFAVVHPVHVTVQDASLARLALAGPNGTALAYEVSLAVAMRNSNWAMRAEPGANAPLDAELLFASKPLANVRLLQGRSSRGIRPGKTEVYHVAAAGESVQLGSSELADFVKQSAAGSVFRLELKLAGDIRYPPHRHVHRVNVACPLELRLSSATAVARFTKIKCVG
jgi:hypothetical protein